MKKVNELFAFVYVNKKGDEQIMEFDLWEDVPIVTDDMELIKDFISLVKKEDRYQNIPYRIYRFSHKEDITDEVK